VGLARVVSDLATYAYLTDVVIVEAWRGRGLGRWLVECILAHPDFQGLRRVALLTGDAQDLYARFGFGRPPAGITYMEITGPTGSSHGHR
jgi:N-acetylglutamate synthase-like GNAT family acetyltransferase